MYTHTQTHTHTLTHINISFIMTMYKSSILRPNMYVIYIITKYHIIDATECDEQKQKYF